MISNFTLRLTLIVALAFGPAAAVAWRAFNWMNVNPVSDSVFEVVGRVGSGAADYWCGAGDFARQVLNTGATQRIYIWRGYGPSVTEPGRRGVQFSLLAPEGAERPPGYSLSVKAVGDSLTSAAAFQYCLPLPWLFELY